MALELEQMVTDYWREVDFNGGNDATNFFTQDVVADFGAIQFQGHEGVRGFYADRLAKIREQQKDGIRTTRHVYQNLQIVFREKDRADLSFLIITYGGGGHPPVADAAVPVSISDTRFECRLGEDGQWRIFGFYGSPIFLGTEEFARNALIAK